jgi:glutamine amidotransferase
MQSVALIDYGSGNLRSAEKALVRAAAGKSQIIVTSDPESVAAADRVVLPGVGAFAACMKALSERPGLIEAMTHAVKEKGRPFLGVCVGMQLLATRGLEFGETPGLDWISGDVRRVQPQDATVKIPHMGWNNLIDPHGPTPIAEIGESPMYFTHSFAFYPSAEEDVAAWVEHGERFAAAVAKDNVAGVQFHPEKSQSAGIALLARFLEWRP